MDLNDLKIDRSSKPTAANRPRRRGGSPWITRAVLALVIVGVAWLFWRPASAWVDRMRLPTLRLVEVAESHPAAVGAVRGTAANGYVVAARRAALSADTPGRIVDLRVTEGSVVARDEIVAQLFNDEYAAALQRAQADTKAAEADVARAAAATEAARATEALRGRDLEAATAAVTDAVAAEAFAKAQLEREQSLFDTGIASQDDLDAKRERFDRAEAQLNRARAQSRAADAARNSARAEVAVAVADKSAAEARVAVAQAAAAQAQATYDKTFVRAPFAGLVVLKDAEVGEVVSPNSQGGSNARGSICTMVDLDSLEVQADVPETSLAAVRVGGPAQIFLDAFPETAYTGRVDRIWPTANRQKATVEVRIAFDARDDKLRPDMGVRVVFAPDDVESGTDAAGQATGQATGVATGQATSPRILVPETAVVRIDGQPGAFRVERDVVTFVPVALGARRAGRVTVESGLSAGDKIVAEPPPSLQSGDRIRVES